MEITVSELAAMIGGQLASEADGFAKITGVASLLDALPGDIAFFGTLKYLSQLHVTKATAALVPTDFAESVPPICIRCTEPSRAFTKIVERFAPPPIRFSPGVHPTAIIGHNVKLGSGVSIQPYVVIEDDAQIGDDTVLGAHAYIGHAAAVGSECLLHARVTVSARCVVGNRVIIHSGVVLGADGFGYELRDGHYIKIRQTGIVQVDDDVEIGANTCVDRARFGRTWIGAGSKVDNLVQLGHNVVVGRHSIVCGQVGIAGSTVVGNRVTIAGQAGIAGHLDIGDDAIIAAQAGVTKSLAGKETWMGFPAIPAGDFKKQFFHMRSIGKLKERIRVLEKRLGIQEKPSSES